MCLPPITTTRGFAFCIPQLSSKVLRCTVIILNLPKPWSVLFSAVNRTGFQSVYLTTELEIRKLQRRLDKSRVCPPLGTTAKPFLFNQAFPHPQTDIDNIRHLPSHSPKETPPEAEVLITRKGRRASISMKSTKHFTVACLFYVKGSQTLQWCAEEQRPKTEP